MPAHATCVKVVVTWLPLFETVLIAGSDGTFADVRPLVRINITVIAVAGQRREQGSDGGGGRFNQELVRDNGSVC
jgi:TldD protein